MKLVELLARVWVALSWLAMCLVALLLVVVCWPFLRSSRRRAVSCDRCKRVVDTGPGAVLHKIAGRLVCRDCAPGCRCCDHPDQGDETQDIATEGLGLATPSLVPWPGMDAIDAIRRANPQLTDMHAYAVAKARQRLAVR